MVELKVIHVDCIRALNEKKFGILAFWSRLIIVLLYTSSSLCQPSAQTIMISTIQTLFGSFATPLQHHTSLSCCIWCKAIEKDSRVSILKKKLNYSCTFFACSLTLTFTSTNICTDAMRSNKVAPVSQCLDKWNTLLYQDKITQMLLHTLVLQHAPLMWKLYIYAASTWNPQNTSPQGPLTIPKSMATNKAKSAQMNKCSLCSLHATCN